MATRRTRDARERERSEDTKRKKDKDAVESKKRKRNPRDAWPLTQNGVARKFILPRLHGAIKIKIYKRSSDPDPNNKFLTLNSNRASVMAGWWGKTLKITNFGKLWPERG